MTFYFQEPVQALGLSHLTFCRGDWMAYRLLACHSAIWKHKVIGNSLVTTWKNRFAGPGSVGKMAAETMGRGEKHQRQLLIAIHSLTK